MRLFSVSLVLALFCLLPEMAEARDWVLPGSISALTKIPHVMMSYMDVFFHELGHTVTSWLYGQPALPAFNFADGGGVSVPLTPRSLLLQGLVYAGIGYVGWLMWQDRSWGLLTCLAVLTAAHAGFAIGERYLNVVSYMGHGGATLVGCFCVCRAAMNKTFAAHGPVERYLNMTFGLFTVMSNFFMAWNVATNDIFRDVYEQGIGGHLTNDFSAIALRLDIKVENVAIFSLVFITACCLATAVILVDFLRRKKEEESA